MTMVQLLEFNLAIPSVYNGLLCVPSAVYASLVVGLVTFIDDFFPIAAVR